MWEFLFSTLHSTVLLFHQHFLATFKKYHSAILISLLFCICAWMFLRWQNAQVRSAAQQVDRDRSSPEWLTIYRHAEENSNILPGNCCLANREVEGMCLLLPPFNQSRNKPDIGGDMAYLVNPMIFISLFRKEKEDRCNLCNFRV